MQRDHESRSPISCRIPEKLKRARVHPINVLVAMRTYASGKSEKGKSSWTPDPDSPTRWTLRSTTPTARWRPPVSARCSRWMCPARWSGPNCSGLPITPREACAAIALVTANVEPNHEFVGFTSGGWQFSGPRTGTQRMAGVRA